MNKLEIIENELVPVYETSTGEKVVYGSELHEVLGVRTPYKDWSTRRLNDIDAVENEDFEAAQICAPSGQTKKDHIIKLDIAKEMAMLERNEKGKQVRRYFIQIEKKYKANQFAGLSAELKAVIVVDKRVTKVENEVKMLGRELEDFKMDMPILGVEIDEITAAARRKGVECLGGKKSNAYHDRSLRSKVYHDIYGELKRQFGVSTYKAIKRSQCQDALGVINKYTLPYILEEQIKDCNAQINMEVA
ncbi:phage anti-repressor protein [Faecalimonas umbilicata]|uniref:Antirepressor n=1 Tax=Faecalimonas umbilicata TaxID=1912855 RepID=A0A4R3JPG1_9FIRM|nr:ORF6C domain-containing protein [Faecalimonas umbilicata]TCS68615.1 phage anti-repressor protein [Faecalimonas umbilicata]GBU05177.1 antirepressor [Faecalimonas umbilicata]